VEIITIIKNALFITYETILKKVIIDGSYKRISDKNVIHLKITHSCVSRVCLCELLLTENVEKLYYFTHNPYYLKINYHK